MSYPPFKRSSASLAAESAGLPEGMAELLPEAACCDHEVRLPELEEEPPADAPQPNQRPRLHHLPQHLHCSVIGTCLSTTELRRLMARYMEVKDVSDLDIHHVAVEEAAYGGPVSKALHRALERRHAGAVRSFALARDEVAVDEAWQQAWLQGEIPGAYWALLTHKLTSPALRQLAFGEVHMLSHLMGSANRREIQRFVAMERGFDDLQARLDREVQKRQQLVAERQALTEQLHQQAVAHEQELARARAARPESGPSEQELQRVALQTERRERAERDSQQAQALVEELRRQLELLQLQTASLTEELSAAEDELQALSADAQAPGEAELQLAGQTVLYVGGRPGSMPAIRDFVLRHGGNFLHHDGGLEARKGLLGAQLPGADLVVFPVDCVDHDSVQNLKRLCERHQRPFLALRSASLASLAAALRARGSAPDAALRFCLRHG